MQKTSNPDIIAVTYTDLQWKMPMGMITSSYRLSGIFTVISRNLRLGYGMSSISDLTQHRRTRVRVRADSAENATE